jgi:hypothetical protein
MSFAGKWKELKPLAEQVKPSLKGQVPPVLAPEPRPKMMMIGQSTWTSMQPSLSIPRTGSCHLNVTGTFTCLS